MKNKVNLRDKFKLFNEYWTPKIVGDLNESYVKIAKLKGEFVWHSHENEDEFFLVTKGILTIKLRDRDIILNEGEFFIVPKGIEHMTVAPEEVHVVMIEPKSTVNTGDVKDAKTVENPDWI
jgi:mannose-6-phosphate isomerase-like protein (cupin superfamily)